MLLLVLAAAGMLCLSGTARAQSDTSRRRPSVHAAPSALVWDSSRVRGIDSLEVLRFEPLADWMGPVVRRRMREQLAARHKLWEQRRPRAYVIRVLDISDCIEVRMGPRVAGELLRDRLVVRDTTVVRREGAPISAAYEQRCLLGWRVDDLFADVARALADTSAYIHDLEYDPAYGFPRAYWLTRGYTRVGGVLVESFAPAP